MWLIGGVDVFLYIELKNLKSGSIHELEDSGLKGKGEIAISLKLYNQNNEPDELRHA